MKLIIGSLNLAIHNAHHTFIVVGAETSLAVVLFLHLEAIEENGKCQDGECIVKKVTSELAHRNQQILPSFSFHPWPCTLTSERQKHGRDATCTNMTLE